MYPRVRIPTAMELERHRQEILRIAGRYGARNVRLFGSVARGEDQPGSDVDVLVDMSPERSLLDLVGFGQELEELLHRRVDVVTDAGLHPVIRGRILAEARQL